MRTLLIEALKRAGIEADAPALGENNAANLPPRGETIKLPVVAKLVSPPFSENVKLILKVSHNLHAHAADRGPEASGHRSRRAGPRREQRRKPAAARRNNQAPRRREARFASLLGERQADPQGEPQPAC